MAGRGLGDPIEHALIGAFLGAVTGLGIWLWWAVNTFTLPLIGLLCCIAVGALTCAVFGYFFGEIFFGWLGRFVGKILMWLLH